MHILIQNSIDAPIYEQIVDQIKESIMKGELTPGELLPSIRGLAKDLKISVITTKRAYDELSREGYIEIISGKGCFVSHKNKNIMQEEILSNMEQDLQKIVTIAKYSEITEKQLHDIITLFYEEDNDGK